MFQLCVSQGQEEPKVSQVVAAMAVALEVLQAVPEHAWDLSRKPLSASPPPALLLPGQLVTTRPLGVSVEGTD